MKFSTLFLLATTGSGAAFSFNTAPRSSRFSTELYGGAKGGATTLGGKQKTVEQVNELLEGSEMIFTMPASGLTVKQVSGLRRSLPEGTTMRVVKNKLMARAIEGNSNYESVGSLLKGANMWFFVEEDISGSLKAIKGFLKENQKGETHQVSAGVIDGDLLDADGVKRVGDLPSKLELYARIAGGIKAVPTKLAKATNAVPSKLARAIKLAGETKE